MSNKLMPVYTETEYEAIKSALHQVETESIKKSAELHKSKKKIVELDDRLYRRGRQISMLHKLMEELVAGPRPPTVQRKLWLSVKKALVYKEKKWLDAWAKLGEDNVDYDAFLSSELDGYQPLPTDSTIKNPPKEE